MERYKGILLFEKAIELFNEKDLKGSTSLFIRYKDEFPNGEYKSIAEQRLKTNDITRIVEEQSEILEQAINDNDIQKIYEVVDYTDSLDASEVKDICNKANIHIREYEELRESHCNKAIKSDEIRGFRDFISHYEDDKRAVDFVYKMKDKLLEKDTELFNEAEYKTKNVLDFKFYIHELGEKGINYQKAKERVEELNCFALLTDKSDYENYMSNYPKGLKRKEATQRIIDIEEEKNLSVRFEEALKSNSIEIYQGYLIDYEHKKDQRFEAINAKYLQLKETQQEEGFFIKITNTTEYEKYKLCTEYLAIFKGKYRFEEVKKIQQEVKNEIDNDTAFRNIVLQNNPKGFEEFQEKVSKGYLDYRVEDYNLYLIKSFENFKKEFNSERNYDNADDYILYLRAKESKKRSDFKFYLDQFQQGINFPKAKDGLLFLDALDQKKIDALADYLQSSTLLEFKIDAEVAIKELEKANRIQTAFQEIQRFDGDINEAIKLCSNYLLEYEGYNKEYDRRVAELKSQLTYEREEDNDGKEAIEKNTEETFLSYLNKHKNKGRHYKTITKLLREKQLGVTEKDILNVVQDIAGQMEKSSKDNSQTVTELIQKFSNQMVMMENDRNKERRIFYFGLVFLVFATAAMVWFINI